MRLTHYPPWLQAAMYIDPIANRVFALTLPGKKTLVRRDSAALIEIKGI